MKLFTEQELKAIVKEEAKNFCEGIRFVPERFYDNFLYDQIEEKLSDRVDVNQKNRYIELLRDLVRFFIYGNYRDGLRELMFLFEGLEVGQKPDFDQIEVVKDEIKEVDTCLITDLLNS